MVWEVSPVEETLPPVIVSVWKDEARQTLQTTASVVLSAAENKKNNSNLSPTPPGVPPGPLQAKKTMRQPCETCHAYFSFSFKQKLSKGAFQKGRKFAMSVLHFTLNLTQLETFSSFPSRKDFVPFEEPSFFWTHYWSFTN